MFAGHRDHVGDAAEVLVREADDTVLQFGRRGLALDIEKIITGDVGHRAVHARPGDFHRRIPAHFDEIARLAEIADADEGDIGAPCPVEGLLHRLVLQQQFAQLRVADIGRRIEGFAAAVEGGGETPGDVVRVQALASPQRAADGTDERAVPRVLAAELCRDRAEIAPHADGNRHAVGQFLDQMVRNQLRDGDALQILVLVVDGDQRMLDAEPGLQFAFQVEEFDGAEIDADGDQAEVARLPQHAADLGARQVVRLGNLVLRLAFIIILLGNEGNQTEFLVIDAHCIS